MAAMALWMAWNLAAPLAMRFDPYPFGFLTLVVSLEAIFLAIFVLIGQSREAVIAELREELTLQVNLRMEAEVTKTLQLVAGLYTRLGHKIAEDEELREMLKALDAERLEQDLIDVHDPAEHILRDLPLSPCVDDQCIRESPL